MFKKQMKNHFLVKKTMTYKNLFQYLLTKVSGGYELGTCGSQDQCPRPLSYDDIQENRSI